MCIIILNHNTLLIMYTFHTTDRTYSEWNIEPPLVIPTFSPLQHKLLHGDQFELDNSNIHVVHSPLKKKSIPAVLYLTGNKTYGRNGKGKLMYRAIPHAIEIPPVLVPYEMKNVGWSKAFENVYVTVRIDEWRETYPVGIITNVIGNVSELVNFYEYQIHCSHLCHSLSKFHKRVSELTEPVDFCDLEDRTDRHVISIDPEGCVDIDDAMGAIEGDNNTTVVSIYIANVPWMLSKLHLWDCIEASERITTIYLPHGNRPMLPSRLSEMWCSLHQTNKRPAFALDVVLDAYSGKYMSHSFHNVLVSVRQNYTYDSPALLNDVIYSRIVQLTPPEMSSDSHNVVAHWMIQMNHLSAKHLLSHRLGIGRSQEPTDLTLTPVKHKPFFHMWNQQAAAYVTSDNWSHSALNLMQYTHITSPIRRMVDIVNMCRMQQTMNSSWVSPEAVQACIVWESRVEYINDVVKRVRKVQRTCNLLHAFTNEKTHSLLEGVCFNKQRLNDKEQMNDKQQPLFKYKVYLPHFKEVASVITFETWDDFTTHMFTAHMFINEHTFCRKVRLSPCD